MKFCKCDFCGRETKFTNVERLHYTNEFHVRKLQDMCDVCMVEMCIFLDKLREFPVKAETT